MPSSTDESPETNWELLFGSEEVRAAFTQHNEGLARNWTALTEVAATSQPPLGEALGILAKVSSLYVRADDWNQPYGPALSIQDRRSAVPTDLTLEELAVLESCAPHVPNALLRARAFDVLCLLSTGRARVDFSVLHLDAILSEPIRSELWTSERQAWDRAVLVARRFGAPTKRFVARLEQELRRVVRTSSEGFVPLRAADLLAKHSLASGRAAIIAARLDRVSNMGAPNPERYRAYQAGASEWFRRARDVAAADQAALRELQSLVDEAELLAAQGGNAAARASHLFELALQKVRKMSRTSRTELGVEMMPSFIARRIRELGAAALGSMHAFTSESIDLSSAAREARDRVKGLSAVDALAAFARLAGFSNYQSEVSDANRSLSEHVFQSLFSTVHYSHDGRIIHRSQSGEMVYGLDSQVWKQLMFTYDLRVKLMVQGLFHPAWVQMTNEHRLGLGDFVEIVRSGGIVPSDRAIQFARGLYYGYDGDFSSAAQLLTPQLENLVRHHLANAGISTSYITEQRTEMEAGISTLMDRPHVDDVFGEDLAFELRALLCGPIGPNLRNEVAHGLLSDGQAVGAETFYLWWFSLRLTFVPYWNALHDVDAAEGREPARPSEPEQAGEDEQS